MSMQHQTSMLFVNGEDHHFALLCLLFHTLFRFLFRQCVSCLILLSIIEYLMFVKMLRMMKYGEYVKFNNKRIDKLTSTKF